MKWRREKVGLIDMPIVDYLEKIFEEEIEKGYEFKVCIGTDSQKAGKGYKFATAIVIETKELMGHETIKHADGTEETVPLYVGRGGIVMGTTFWEEMKTSTQKKRHREIEILNQRMLKEVSTSIAIGYEVWPLCDLYGVSMEIHADINADPRHPSNAAMKEAIGYIVGMQWDYKIKPDAFAASTAADSMC